MKMLGLIIKDNMVTSHNCSDRYTSYQTRSRGHSEYSVSMSPLFCASEYGWFGIRKICTWALSDVLLSADEPDEHELCDGIFPSCLEPHRASCLDCLGYSKWPASRHPADVLRAAAQQNEIGILFDLRILAGVVVDSVSCSNRLPIGPSAPWIVPKTPSSRCRRKYLPPQTLLVVVQWLVIAFVVERRFCADSKRSIDTQSPSACDHLSFRLVVGGVVCDVGVLPSAC